MNPAMRDEWVEEQIEADISDSAETEIRRRNGAESYRISKAEADRPAPQRRDNEGQHLFDLACAIVQAQAAMLRYERPSREPMP